MAKDPAPRPAMTATDLFAKPPPLWCADRMAGPGGRMLAGCFDQVMSVVLEIRRRDAPPVRELQRGVVRHDLGNAMLLQFALEPDDELIRCERVQLHPSLPQKTGLLLVGSVQPERIDIAIPDVGRRLGLQLVCIDVGEPEADVDHPQIVFERVSPGRALQRPDDREA
jgi:hypothetical protein